MEDEIILPLYLKWRYFIDLFLMIIDKKHGNFLHLPTDNSPHEQPYTTMQVMTHLRELWIEKLQHDEEKSLKRR